MNENGSAAEKNNRATNIWICLILFFCSLALNSFNNDFPIGYHFDEIKKVHFIKSNEQDFHHPVLILEAIRIPNRLLGLEVKIDIAILGRFVIAIFGALIPVTLFWLARQSMSLVWSVGVAMAVAVSPTIVIHSHYIKEDIPLTLFCLLTIWSFSRYLKNPGLRRVFIPGVLFGLAIATHYKSLLLLPVFGGYLLIHEFRSLPRHLLSSLVVLLTGAYIFLLVNNVIIDDLETFWTGFNHERQHATSGHTVPIYWEEFFLCYHLVFSVVPSMTLPIAVICLIAFFWYTFRYRDLSRLEQLLIGFGWISYLVPEISPLKPNPDECRYVLPLIPILILFGGKLGFDLISRLEKNRFYIRPTLTLLFAATGIAWPLLDSSLLCFYLKDDTRKMALEYVESNGFTYEYEPMAGTSIDKQWGYAIDLNELHDQQVTHFACSSFAYDIYFLRKPNHRESSRDEDFTSRSNRYLELFERECKTFKPKHRSFGFSNPTIKLIEVDPSAAGESLR